MGLIVQFGRRRALDASTRTTSSQSHDADERRALVILAVVFAATAVAMGIAVVVAGSSTWTEAVPLIAFVVVFALTKVVLADALFYVMIRSDVHAEAKAVEAAARAHAARMVIRRPPRGAHLRSIVGRGIRPRRAELNGFRPTIVPRPPRGDHNR